MGFFDSVKSKLGFGPSEENQLGAFTHRRYHARYLINDRDLCKISHMKHGVFRVIDLSHHGCLVEPVGDSSFDQCVVPSSLELSICGQSIPLEISAFQRRKNGWGLIFRHAHEASIRNLGQFIEPLRTGNSVEDVCDEAPSRGSPAKSRRRFKGDGPFDLVLEKNMHGKLDFLMITTRVGQADISVIWEDDKFVTKKTTGTEGAMMEKTSNLDKTILWTLAACCLGIKHPDGAVCSRILFTAIDATNYIHMAKSS